MSETKTIREYLNVVVDKDYNTAQLYCNLPENILNEDNAINRIALTIMDVLIQDNVYAPDEGRLSELLDSLKNNLSYDNPFLVAETVPPQDGKDARIEWLIGPYTDENQSVDTDKVDMREFSSLVVLVEDQIICVKHHARPGTPGKKVNGTLIPCKTGKDIEFKCNSGVKVEEHKGKTVFKSAISGYLVANHNSAIVCETLIINGDVDYSTGNIHYIKDIHIKGNVLSGFTIETEGDIVVEGFVENGSTLEAKGNITIQQGVIGEKTSITAGGSITAAYVHHASMHSEGNIRIKKFVLDADLYAAAEIEVFGEDLKKTTSAVIGSTLSSDGKIMVNSIGSYLAARTVVKLCDIAGRIKKEFEQVKDYQRHLIQVIKKINTKLSLTGFMKMIDRMSPRQKEAYKELLEYIKNLIDEIRRNKTKIERTKRALTQKLDQAELTVPAKMIPPCLIVFGDKLKKEQAETSQVRYVYDRHSQKIERSVISFK